MVQEGEGTYHCVYLCVSREGVTCGTGKREGTYHCVHTRVRREGHVLRIHNLILTTPSPFPFSVRAIANVTEKVFTAISVLQR